MEVEPFTKGSTVEVSSDEEGFQGAWYVATLLDIVDASQTKTSVSNKRNRDKKKLGYLVRYATLFQENSGTELLTEIVHPSYVRPLPPRNPRRDNGDQAVAEAETETDEGNAGDGGDFQVYDVVDVYLRDGWWIGVVGKVVADGEMKKYSISFESPPEEVEFEGSQMRLHVDWINSRWKLRPQKTPNQVATDKNATQIPDSNNGVPNSDLITPKRESPFLISSHQISAEKNSFSQNKVVTNVQSSVGVENSGSKGNTEDIISKDVNGPLKRKRGRRAKKPNASLEENLCDIALEHDEPMVNDSQTTENHYVLPFVKRSPLWAAIESLDLSQNPHFSPLWETKEDHREGSAIAHMVTFANVVQRTKSLQWTDPSSVIKNSLETLVDLEANGFDVGPVRARLDELLAKKCEASRLEGEMKEVEKEVEKCNSEKRAIDEEIDGLKRKMARAVAMKDVKDKEDIVVRNKLQVVSKRIVHWKVAFEELAGTPL